METKERSLAYIKAKAVPTDKLYEISGGSNKLTIQKVRRKTNYPPGYDETEDVYYD
ncbi:hypothetical protein [Legionella yabuuchiae]|uniref:hypothetical protein n=1 Tax=Legionella yabuuchiae TaxID=376727 RepID=UPI0013EFBE8E|nr:hypothetical protein [Legionella yabuuchiae]